MPPHPCLFPLLVHNRHLVAALLCVPLLCSLLHPRRLPHPALIPAQCRTASRRLPPAPHNLTIFKVVTGSRYALFYTPHIPSDDLQGQPFTPLSASIFFCSTGIRYIFFRLGLLRRFPQIVCSVCMPICSRKPREELEDHLDDFFFYSMIKTVEEFAFGLKPDTDHTSLLWTFNSLDEDTELEKNFELLPCLCDSEAGEELELRECFIRQNKKRLSSALIGLMNRTLLPSNLISEAVRERRKIICTNVVRSTSLLGLLALRPHWRLV